MREYRVGENVDRESIFLCVNSLIGICFIVCFVLKNKTRIKIFNLLIITTRYSFRHFAYAKCHLPPGGRLGAAGARGCPETSLRVLGTRAIPCHTFVILSLWRRILKEKDPSVAPLPQDDTKGRATALRHKKRARPPRRKMRRGGQPLSHTKSEGA